MKKQSLISLAMVAALSLSQGAAWAQPGRGNDKSCNGPNCERGRNNANSGGRGSNDNQGNSDNRGYNDSRGNGDNRGYNDNRWSSDNRGGKQRFANGHDNRRGDERGAGPSHDFYRGQRLPPNYRAPRYVVEDWHGHGLRTPPRGYQWVQTGGDYVLVAIATGIILELLLNR
jgi:Ni/Co efflux regulator RcnB